MGKKQRFSFADRVGAVIAFIHKNGKTDIATIARHFNVSKTSAWRYCNHAHLKWRQLQCEQVKHRPNVVKKIYTASFDMGKGYYPQYMQSYSIVKGKELF